jgi:tRNA G18 (ribose-2'-O)-methylase SpoU
MLANFAPDDWIRIIGALSLLLTAMTAFVSSLRNSKKLDTVVAAAAVADQRTNTTDSKIEAVHAEVKMANSQTLGDLTQDAETRRVLLKLPPDRTATEQAHIDAMANNATVSKPPEATS